MFRLYRNRRKINEPLNYRINELLNHIIKKFATFYLMNLNLIF